MKTFSRALFSALLLAGAAASISPAGATSTLDVTVQCQGDLTPTGVPLTMIDWNGLQALKAVCDTKGDSARFGAQVLIDVDPRTSAAGGFARRTGSFTVPVVVTHSTAPFGEVTAETYPATFTIGDTVYTFRRAGGLANGLIYRDLETGDRFTRQPDALSALCAAGDEIDCSVPVTTSTGGQTVQTSTSYVLVCPSSYHYTIVVDDVALGSESTGGGACQWKAI